MAAVVLVIVTEPEPELIRILLEPSSVVILASIFELVIVMSLEAVIVTVAEFGKVIDEVSPVTTDCIVEAVISIVVPAVTNIAARPSLATRAFTVELLIPIEVPAFIVIDAPPDTTEAVISLGSIDIDLPARIMIVAVLGKVVPSTSAMILPLCMMMSLAALIVTKEGPLPPTKA